MHKIPDIFQYNRQKIFLIEQKLSEKIAGFMKSWVFFRVSALVIAVSSSIFSSPVSEKWFLEQADLQALRMENQVILDARDEGQRKKRPLANAIPVQWEIFSENSDTKKGLLKSKLEILEILSKLKIQKTSEVLVIGDPSSGWGEDARIVYTLRSVGVLKSYLIDGGANSFFQFLSNQKQKPSGKKSVSLFQKTSEDLTVALSELKKDKISKDLFIVDSRDTIEYRGVPIYGEERGGHIPNAASIPFKQFLGKDGKILPKEKVLNLLKTKGWKEGQTVVSYCTGGVRSSFTTAVLRNYGISAKNYSGSMWEYSSQNAEEFPLEKF